MRLLVQYPTGTRGLRRLMAGLRRQIPDLPPAPTEPKPAKPAPVPVSIRSRRALAIYGPVVPGEDAALEKLASATARPGATPWTAAAEVFGRKPTRGAS